MMQERAQSISIRPRRSRIRPPEPGAMRDQILRCAARFFRHKGYHATTLRAISKVVGILSGSLFHHFVSKEQMLLEIMHEAASSMCVRADEIADAKDMAPKKRLRGLIALQLDCLLSEGKGDFYAVLISEWREVKASKRLPLTAMRRRYFRAWHRVLEDCDRAGILRVDPDTTLLALHGAINWANTWFKASGRLSLDDYARLLERLVLVDGALVDVER
jgi:TetR/AcrR family transcriptional regulator, cholesterol catabolism regulator